MTRWLVLLLILEFGISSCVPAKKNQHYPKDLTVVIIRHAEKAPNGDNLNCQGLNRSLELPAVLKQKYGEVDYVYVATPNTGKTTTSVRMLQTISPYAIQYNLPINTKYGSGDEKKIAKEVLNKKGTVLIVWNHSSIADLADKLGLKGKDNSDWKDSDYDSIWELHYDGSKHPDFKLNHEGLTPDAKCPTL